MKTLLGALVTIGLLLPGIAQAGGNETPDATITAAQADRGQEVYDEFCLRCHGDQLYNGQFGPPIKGSYFRDKWTGESIGALYLQTVKTMPPDNPGFLTDQEYADLIAFLLQENGMTPGDGELPADPEALKEMALPW